jgi:uncharacterized protein DUF4123
MTPEHEKIADALFSAVRAGESLYAILDAAGNIDIAYQLQNISNVEYVSLYKGRKEEPMWDAAPYLTLCVRDSEFFNWMIERGWGDSWGIFVISKATLEDLCKHFQEFLLVQDEDGKQMYFRFYDPRVLPPFLSTCAREQRLEFFGPVNQVLLEARDTNVLRSFTSV